MVFLLALIYVSFISLGLPDAILGASWPLMQMDLNVPVAYAGIGSILVSVFTIFSSLNSAKLIRRYGTGLVTATSVALTAVSILLISNTANFFWLCVLFIPLGLGAGCVDSGLNDFVANHYEAKHMNWLHCFWGIGATGGPIVMGAALANGASWRGGYLVIGILQAVLTAVLFIALPLWKKAGARGVAAEEKIEAVGLLKLLKVPLAKPVLLSFFCYCAIESGVGLWASSFMVAVRGVDAKTAAGFTSLFFLGITLGRFLAGFISVKLNNKQMIRLGEALLLVGIALFIMPFGNAVMLAALILMGMGCAPIFPSMLHETPNRFGKALSQAVMGTQMAGAYLGGLLMPPLFGFISGFIGLWWLPLYLAVLFVLMTLSSEYVGKRGLENGKESAV